MKSVNIRSLKHETKAILERVAMGETVEISRRNRKVAILKPIEAEKESVIRPNFRKRLQAIYGDRILATTATELIATERGER